MVQVDGNAGLRSERHSEELHARMFSTTTRVTGSIRVWFRVGVHKLSHFLPLFFSNLLAKWSFILFKAFFKKKKSCFQRQLKKCNQSYGVKWQMEKETKKEQTLETFTGKCHHWKEDKQSPSPKLLVIKRKLKSRELTAWQLLNRPGSRSFNFWFLILFALQYTNTLRPSYGHKDTP